MTANREVSTKILGGNTDSRLLAKRCLSTHRRVAGVIEEFRRNRRDVRQPVAIRRSKSTVNRLQRARSMAAATSSLNSSALCNAPLILTISISRAAICPAGSL